MQSMEKFNKYIGVICLLLLLLLIIIMPHQIIWDEEWYFARIGYIDAFGFTPKFVLSDPAAPMHAIVHYLFTPITHRHSPQIRFLDLSMCVGISIILYRILKMDKQNTNVPLRYTFSMFLLPSFFVLGFFAITEAPCLLFYTISVFFLMKYVLAEKQALLYMILSGVFLGCAILTRQMFLVCIGPTGALIFYKQYRYRWPAVVLYSIGAVLVFGPVFYLWKGMVPPTSMFRGNTSGISVKHIYLSFGYAFFYFLTLMPVYVFQFIKKNWKMMLCLAITGLYTSTLIGDNEFVPLSGLLPHLFSTNTVNIIAFSFFKIIGMAGLMAMYFLFYELYSNRKDFRQVFLVLSMLSILATPAIILDGFSSRYSMQIAPILVLFAYSRIRPINTKMQFGINWVAIGINIISVITFFIYG